MPAVINREVDIRGIEYRHVLDAQGYVPGLTPALFPVQFDVITVQSPGITSRFTGGIGAIGHDNDRIVAAAQGFCGTPGVGLMYYIAYLFDACFTGIDLHSGVVTEYEYALITQSYVTLKPNDVVVLVETCLVRLCLQTTLAQ